MLEVDRSINDAIYGTGSSAAETLDGKVQYRGRDAAYNCDAHYNQPVLHAYSITSAILHHDMVLVVAASLRRAFGEKTPRTVIPSTYTEFGRVQEAH